MSDPLQRPVDTVVDVTRLWEMTERGDLTHEQFFDTVGIVVGKRERTPESNAVGDAIRLASTGSADGVRMLRSLTSTV